jgi:epoxyqueuosine reductase
MDLCENCKVCLTNCPTGAISNDRFLLKVDLCLTYHNEQPGDIPFPDWIDPSWHNCLVGCLHCQKLCPANKNVKDWCEYITTFNENEVNTLIQEKEFNNLPKLLQEKLIKIDFKNYTEVIPRNLGVFLN